jgi:hypothetical protein
MTLSLLMCATFARAVENNSYRLLSVADSPKLILISQIPDKTKYLLDATAAKITVNGKPAEFKDLQAYVIVQVKMTLRKFSKDGIDIDGTASEIRILVPQESTQPK